MKYVLILNLIGVALALLLSGYTPPINRGEPVTIHCQVSPDTWKRYTTTVSGSGYDLRKYGAWSFRTESGLQVLSSICHMEVKE